MIDFLDFLEPLSVVAATGRPLAEILAHAIVHEGRPMIHVDTATSLTAQALAELRDEQGGVSLSDATRAHEEIRARANGATIITMSTGGRLPL